MGEWHSYRALGLERVPLEGSTLLVVNHSLATYDVFLLCLAIFEQTGRIARGLGDRKIFQTPGLRQLAQSVGTIKGSPGAASRLLSAGHLVLVAPGGMKEALRTERERYKLRWESRRGFVRLAIESGAQVVLAACPRADDLYDVKDSALTAAMYDRYKFPMPFFEGNEGGLLPKRIALTHLIGEPIQAPDDMEAVDDFHHQLTTEMEALMKAALEL